MSFHFSSEDYATLESMIQKAEKTQNKTEYSYDPGFTAYSCSCTAHKKSCGWD
ncbi:MULTISPECIES: hypothetical protein [Erysipelotrichaceae]|uniref:hypothetical protein n=1 Tax=Erysipelotrichaceae TaxID=128827 RepID=UPI0013016D95|nr:MULTISPECIES: hypothetical protein [Erysipelotrichaceae]